ncbi:unnamed protein product, partial [Owenia fusiformis]
WGVYLGIKMKDFRCVSDAPLLYKFRRDSNEKSDDSDSDEVQQEQLHKTLEEFHKNLEHFEQSSVETCDNRNYVRNTIRRVFSDTAAMETKRQTPMQAIDLVKPYRTKPVKKTTLKRMESCPAHMTTIGHATGKRVSLFKSQYLNGLHQSDSMTTPKGNLTNINGTYDNLECPSCNQPLCTSCSEEVQQSEGVKEQAYGCIRRQNSTSLIEMFNKHGDKGVGSGSNNNSQKDIKEDIIDLTNMDLIKRVASKMEQNGTHKNGMMNGKHSLHEIQKSRLRETRELKKIFPTIDNVKLFTYGKHDKGVARKIRMDSFALRNG